MNLDSGDEPLLDGAVGERVGGHVEQKEVLKKSGLGTEQKDLRFYFRLIKPTLQLESN